MPNPKLGTVATDISEAVKLLKKGRVEFRADKGGIIRTGVGKKSFTEDALYENAIALMKALLSARPKGVKGVLAGGFVTWAWLSTTMGSSVPISVHSLVQTALEGKETY